MNYAQKYRIYPNKQQKEFLEKSFGCSRFVYNHFLAKNNKQYAENKKSDSYVKNSSELTKLKKEHEWLNEVSAVALQQSLRNLDTAYTGFFRKNTRYPNFKKKSNKNSFSIPQVAKVVGRKLSIPKCRNIKIALNKELPEFKTVTISKTPDGKYYASFSIEDEREFPKKPKLEINKTIGIDLGIKSFAVISTGEVIDNPRHLKSSLNKLKKEQRKLSKKKKGGQNRGKQRVRVARVHQRIANQRKDFLHKLTYRLTHENQVNSICIEDLAVSNMMKNHKLAQAISDVSWSEFRRQLTYKCDWYGKNLIVINRFDPSSKMCRHCGEITELTLADRAWTCRCGELIDRDLNAALNIKSFGIEQYRRNYGNLKPVESKIRPVRRQSSKKRESTTF